MVTDKLTYGLTELFLKSLSRLKKRKGNSNQHRKKEEEPTECDICNVIFTTKRSYQRHYKTIHELKGILDCDECGKQFKQNQSLILHKESVHNKKKLYCPHCPKVFAYGCRLNMKKHIKKAHWFHCDGCKVSFEHNHELDSHIQTEHIAKYC